MPERAFAVVDAGGVFAGGRACGDEYIGIGFSCFECNRVLERSGFGARCCAGFTLALGFTEGVELRLGGADWRVFLRHTFNQRADAIHGAAGCSAGSGVKSAYMVNNVVKSC